ncbi:DUF1707 SHOCT-like domain-containing protein [Nocardioides cynanchi]|uniref:DUF1707 SHOCT-like domain-containing protein n=1 Tax=Nocardioides cynanchi TaxID=2558918 RepID=UPI00124845E5|nr:DUF1707 domain-containing protein [Nocardioides cynanchi]
MDTPDPSQLRISDQDRHQVAEVLREAAGEGRIDFDELDQRLEATYSARTYADLVPITLDLPTTAATQLPARAAAATPSPVVPGPAEERHVAILGGFDRTGVWVVPQHLSIFAFMGGVTLDLRQARFAAREVTVTVNAIMGGADITVNPQTHVILEGTGIMGGYSGPSDRTPAELGADAPVVRIRGVAIMGGVSVTRKPVRGDRRELRRSAD